MTGPVLLAFGVWMLFTAEFTWTNVLIGLAGSLLVGLFNQHRFSAGQLIALTVAVWVRLPLAVWESFLIVLMPHRRELVSEETVNDPASPWAVFAQTFLITFTPRSLVISEEQDGKVQLHTIEREGRK